MRSWPNLTLPPALSKIEHKSLALFVSYKKSLVQMEEKAPSLYVCGITPYDATHLGHAATYISFDLIHRYLLMQGKKVTFVENITDIDDPLLERAARDKQAWESLATSQIDLFRADMAALRVLPPQHYRGVVESMSIIIELVQKHIESGLSYSLEGDIYLDLTKVEGALSALPHSLEEALNIFRERGGDPDRHGKHHPLDPLLWHAKKEGDPSWPAKFGEGRPGWHVECVAIALSNIADGERSSISLQGGGSDLTFPHHFMTAMQSRSLTKKEFAGAYVHAGMIGLDGEKMSKSRGNLVFVSKLLQAGITPNVIRIALTLHHYQVDRMWSEELLHHAQSLSSKIEAALSRSEVAPALPAIQKIVDAIANNLDTPAAYKAIQQWCDETENGHVGGSAGEMSRALDSYLGLGY
jgi:L-cysteine:1D-myo-inositol 2-amino-2-deoxy-alpha-D-glucopyranoside ligase